MEIVTTFVAGTLGDPRQEIAEPPSGATMIEVRADLLPPGTNLGELVAASPLPVLLTLRSGSEGGAGPDGGEARRTFFEHAVALPVALLDLEFERDRDLVGSVVAGERVLLSYHPRGAVPGHLEETARGMLGMGTRLVKVVPEAHRLADLLAVLRLALALNHRPSGHRRGVVFATGWAGVASRLLGPLLAAPVAFAAWSRDRAAAPGQVPPQDLLAQIGHLRGRPRSVCAVLGREVAGSLSPRMHNGAFRALGLPNLFVPLEVGSPDELTALVGASGTGGLDALGLPVAGFAVTMPWKETVLPLCDVVAPRARRAGAVNTVLPRPQKILADCTDIDGISGALRDSLVEVAGRHALVVGAGGAARAAAVALDLAGSQVRMAGRDPERVRSAARRVGVASGVLSDSRRCHVAVNATPAGRDGDIPSLLEELELPAGATVVDLPYGPAATGLEVLAGARGWRYVSGRHVLLFQGAAQFAAMHGMAPPIAAMAEALGIVESRE